MIRKVAVMTDSTCCLPETLAKELGIRIVPLIINYRGKSYRDGIDITPEEVYSIMRLKKELPTTSTASPGAFMQAYHELSKEAETILCITLTGLQSKTFETALIAKNMVAEELPDTRIEVLDSRSVAGALGFIVLESARAASRGADLSETIEVARKMMDRVCLLAMLDTLYYLVRGGRIGKAAGWAGSILDVKPILEHTPAVGETMPIARPRTRTKAITYLLNARAERVGEKAVHVNIHHASDPVEAEKMRDTIVARFKCAELYVTEFTPIMGAHTGPGLLGVSFYTSED